MTPPNNPINPSIPLSRISILAKLAKTISYVKSVKDESHNQNLFLAHWIPSWIQKSFSVGATSFASLAEAEPDTAPLQSQLVEGSTPDQFSYTPSSQSFTTLLHTLNHYTWLHTKLLVLIYLYTHFITLLGYKLGL